MAEEKITLRLRSNPVVEKQTKTGNPEPGKAADITLKQPTPQVPPVKAAVVSPVEVALRKPVAVPENKPTVAVEKPKPQPKKKTGVTRAEKNYRWHVIKSIFLLLFIFAFLLFIIAGAASIYAVCRIAEKPKRGEIIYDIARRIRSNSTLNEKYNAITEDIKKFIGKSSEPVLSSEEKSYGGTFRTIRDRSKAGERALENSVREKVRPRANSSQGNSQPTTAPNAAKQ